jgi:hypothetical protein
MCKTGVYAIFIGIFVCALSLTAFAKNGKEDKSLNPEINSSISAEPVDQFQWASNKKLSWSDFRGAVKAASDESAAATDCGIGFKASTNNPAHKPQIIVYNTFYATKSWVRDDAKLPSILTHEQGHFDLCEIYTRKLRERMSNFDAGAPDLKQALMAIYSEISHDYESRQQAYELETTHGTNLDQQKKWSDMISLELM